MRAHRYRLRFGINDQEQGVRRCHSFFSLTRIDELKFWNALGVASFKIVELRGRHSRNAGLLHGPHSG